MTRPIYGIQIKLMRNGEATGHSCYIGMAGRTWAHMLQLFATLSDAIAELR